MDGWIVGGLLAWVLVGCGGTGPDPSMDGAEGAPPPATDPAAEGASSSEDEAPVVPARASRPGTLGPSEARAARRAEARRRRPGRPTDPGAPPPWASAEALEAYKARRAATSGKDRPGRYRPAEPPEGVRSALTALGYVDGTHPVDEDGPTGLEVVVPGEGPGWMLEVSGHGLSVALRDPTGTVRHTWSTRLEALRPADAPSLSEAARAGADHVRRAALLPGGDLVVVVAGAALARLGRDGTVRWTLPEPVHHDLEVVGDTVWTLSRRRVGEQAHDDLVAVDLATGAVSRRIDLVGALEASAWASVVQDSPSDDVLHANAVSRVTDPGPAARAAGLRAGHLLVTSRSTDLVFAVDPAQGGVPWALPSQGWDGSHDPHLVGDRLVLFDNLGAGTRSRVLSVDLGSGEVSVRAGDRPGAGFFTEFCGVATPTGDGGLVVVVSERGRALGLGPDGGVRWRWHSPRRAGEDDRLVATLFDLVPLGEAAPDGF